MSEVPTITMIEPEAAGFLTVADDLAGALQDEAKMEALLARVTEQARSLVPDVSTASGRAELKTHVFKIVRSRTAIDQAALAQTEKWRMQTKQVNKVRFAAVAKLEALENERRAPLTEWEVIEEERQEWLQTLLGSLAPSADRDSHSDDIAAERNRIAAIEIGEDWEEVADAGRERQREALARLDRDRKVAVDREEQQAEIRRMSAELAERKAAEAAAAEAAEKDRARVATLRKRLDTLRRPNTEDWTAEQLIAAADRLTLVAGGWEEFYDEADALRADTIAFLRDRAEKVRERAERDAEQAAAMKAAEDRAAAAERAAVEAMAQVQREREIAAKAAEEARAQAQRARDDAEMAAFEADVKRAAEDRYREEQRKLEAQYEEDRAQGLVTRAQARTAMINALAALLPSDQDDGETSYERAEIVADEIIAGRIPHAVFEPLSAHILTQILTGEFKEGGQ